MHVDDLEVLGPVDAERLNGGVENVEALDARIGELMSAEELGLLLAAVAALGIPPSLSLAVDGVASRALDDDSLA